MDNFYARSVFFVKDAERSIEFYTKTLGFALDWYNDGVFQVSLHGFELILNQTGPKTKDRPGHGRLFVGLEEDQAGVIRKHIEDKGIATTVVNWGNPTLVIRDVDENELFFWYSGKERAHLQTRLEGA